MRPLPFSLSLLCFVTALTPGIAGQEGPRVSAVEYEGWRQYNVHCARCHGQDALPNPVAANLLTSLAPGGPTADQATFTQVVRAGREKQGMPAFGKTVTPEQVDAIYGYLKGRAEKRIPPGRPKEPTGQGKKAPG
jgi:mono/diheme cytochrome c family protein